MRSAAARALIELGGAEVSGAAYPELLWLQPQTEAPCPAVRSVNTRSLKTWRGLPALHLGAARLPTQDSGT